MSDSSRSTRREFLQGKAALAAASDAAWNAVGAGATSELPDLPGECFLLKLSRRAMACQFEIYLNAGQNAHDTEVALAALDLVDRLEDQLSVYRPHSEISQLNQRAAFEAVVVEARLFELIEQAVEIHRETNAAYDITSGPLSGIWGFTRHNGAIPLPAVLATALENVGSQYLELDRANLSIRFSRPSVEINLGSIGKGYALDRSAELFAAQGIDRFLLHGGNSSVLARGAQGSAAREEGWWIGVRDPLRPERRLGQLRLQDRALATSGSGTQFFMHEGRRFGHILDPRSGWPAEGVLSTSVLAPTAALADALSTAFYVMGPTETERYCQAHPQVAALMLVAGPRAGSVQKHFWGVPSEDWMELDPAPSSEAG